MKKRTAITTAIALATTIFTVGELRADGFRFGIGVTPHGTSLSIGYRDGSCHPVPPPGKVRCVPPPPPVRVVHRRPAGHYETRIERYWVDGYWKQVYCRRGRITSVWQPGYWAERTVRVRVRH